MIESKSVEFVYAGKRATICVMRNNGYCWGRIDTEDGSELDVVTPKDLYDEDDDYVIKAYLKVARGTRVGTIEPATGWRK